jgi:hypothetical protein
MFNASTARRYSQPLGYRKFRASRAGRGGPSPCHQIAKTRLRGIHRCGRNDRVSKEASSTGTHGPSGRDTVMPWAGRVNWKLAPRGTVAAAHTRPPWASMIERQIDSPMPIPPDLVV